MIDFSGLIKEEKEKHLKNLLEEMEDVFTIKNDGRYGYKNYHFGDRFKDNTSPKEFKVIGLNVEQAKYLAESLCLAGQEYEFYVVEDEE